MPLYTPHLNLCPGQSSIHLSKPSSHGLVGLVGLLYLLSYPINFGTFHITLQPLASVSYIGV